MQKNLEKTNKIRHKNRKMQNNKKSYFHSVNFSFSIKI